ncbi:hypothetical protein C8R45DRAFT_937453 [Mycena sanguinolenta]|nr:hypothetical protein C8R45DRAFT_937453 [Mycena sanguinolenta]
MSTPFLFVSAISLFFLSSLPPDAALDIHNHTSSIKGQTQECEWLTSHPWYRAYVIDFDMLFTPRELVTTLLFQCAGVVLCCLQRSTPSTFHFYVQVRLRHCHMPVCGGPGFSGGACNHYHVGRWAIPANKVGWTSFLLLAYARAPGNANAT